MTFFRADAKATEIGETLVTQALRQFGPQGLSADRFALTLLLHPEPLDGATTEAQPAGYSWNGDQLFYPCSVVKVFYLAAAQQRLKEGFLTPHEDLSRAMRDMIRVSSNMATNYVIDLVTETTGDTVLPPDAMAQWREKRLWVNRFLVGFGWPEFAGINACQKLMDDERYGREKAFVGPNGDNHNRLTTEATARLFHAIMAGRVVTPERSRAMRDYLVRPLDAQFIRDEPAGQVLGYFAAGLPGDAKAWTKAGWTGWTGDAAASFRRHDAAHVELANGQRFTLVAFTQGREISANMDVLPTMAAQMTAIVSS